MRPPAIIALFLLPLCLNGCDPVSLVVGAGATVGSAAAQERGLSGTVEDAQISAQITQAWASTGTNLYFHITVSVVEGNVQLTGTVEKPEERVEAVRLTWQVPGVRQVKDEIQVTDKSSFVDYLRDVRIANTLRAVMIGDKDIREINYSVDVVNGVIYLMGIAQSQEELDRVIAHGRDIDGVKRIINNVVLKTDPSRRAS